MLLWEASQNSREYLIKNEGLIEREYENDGLIVLKLEFDKDTSVKTHLKYIRQGSHVQHFMFSIYS